MRKLKCSFKQYWKPDCSVKLRNQLQFAGSGGFASRDYSISNFKNMKGTRFRKI